VVGQRQTTAKGHEYWCCQLSFSEQEDIRYEDRKPFKTAEAELKLRRYVWLDDGWTMDNHGAFANPSYFKGKPTELRTLALEVTPDSVVAYWEGINFSSVPRMPVLTERSKKLASVDKFVNHNPPALAMRGALGLICYRATCVCEEATLEPMPNK
jgi:hypothetical protein